MAISSKHGGGGGRQATNCQSHLLSVNSLTVASANPLPTQLLHQWPAVPSQAIVTVSLSATTSNPGKLTLAVANFTSIELTYTDGCASPPLQPLRWKKQKASCKGVRGGGWGVERRDFITTNVIFFMVLYKHFLNPRRFIFAIPRVGCFNPEGLRCVLKHLVKVLMADASPLSQTLPNQAALAGKRRPPCCVKISALSTSAGKAAVTWPPSPPTLPWRS